MKRKLKAALRLLLCTNYILVVEDKDTGYHSFDVNMSSWDARRYSLFLYNFLTDSDGAIAEFNNIIQDLK
jgi:hypothetical protein